MTALLEVEAMSKRFGGVQAVADVTFDGRGGEILSVIGPNGAGKSTLFKLIASFETPSSGEVRVAGRRTSGLAPSQAAARGVARTFQENVVFARTTVRDAVSLAAHLHLDSRPWDWVLGTPRARREERRLAGLADDILGQLELEGVADRPAAGLPHGSLRLLGIAMALATEPKVLLLDEPFAGLNAAETDRCLSLVRRLRRDDRVIVLVEHDMRAVMSVSDRIVVLNFGRKIAEGPPDAIAHNTAVVEAYLGAEDEDLGL